MCGPSMSSSASSTCGNAQILDVVDGADEVAPEILQHLLPGNLVVGDAVELLFEIGGEIIFDIAREEVFQERDHDAALVLAVQALLLELDVAAVLQHLQDRGIGRGTADAELFHALDQRGFRKARRRFGEMLGDGEVLPLQRFALAHGGEAATILVVAVVVAAFLIEREKAVEFDHLAGGAQFQHAGAGLGRDIDGGAFQFGRIPSGWRWCGSRSVHRAAPDRYRGGGASRPAGATGRSGGSLRALPARSWPWSGTGAAPPAHRRCRSPRRSPCAPA